VSAEPLGIWLVSDEVEAFAAALCDQGYRVSATQLLDPPLDGAFAGPCVARARGVAPALRRDVAFEIVEKVLDGRGRA